MPVTRPSRMCPAVYIFPRILPLISHSATGPTPHPLPSQCCCIHRERCLICTGLAKYGRRSLGTLLRYTCEQCTNLSLLIPLVSPQCADRCQFLCLRPSCDGSWGRREYRGDLLRGRQQRFGRRCTGGHMRGLLLLDRVSRTRVSCVAWCLLGEKPSGMSDMAYIVCIAIPPAVTRRPPGAKFLYRDAQLLRRSLSLRVSLAILIVA